MIEESEWGRGALASAERFSPAERAAFRRHGFVVVRGLCDRREADEIGRWIDEVASRPPERGGMMVYLEESRVEPGRRVLSRIEKFAEVHAGLRELVRAEKIVARVEQLLGEPAVLFKEKVNFKLPGSGGFEAHQDMQPGWDDYAPYFLSVLVAIDDSTLENGCLELAAGQHRRGLLGERWKPLQGEQLAGVEFVPYPTAPGDAVFFDCFVPHRSSPNPSGRPRRNVYLTFNRRSDGDHRESYFADKRCNYPPDFEREPGRVYTFRV